MPARPSAVVVGTACYLFSGVFWGLNIPLTAELLRDFDPFWLSACRYAIAATLLGALVLLTLGPRQLRAPIPPARIATMSLFVSGFLVTYNVGLMLVHPITAAALLAGSPVYVAVVSRAMTGAALARGFWPATALTVLGAGVAVWGRASAAGTGLHVGGGEVLIVASIVCWTVYSILAQRWFAPDVPQLRRTWLTALGSLPWLVAFWAIARATGAIGEPNLRPPAAALANLAITAVFSTALASVAWNLGVARLGIAAGGMWQNTVPVFAVLFSLAFFGVVPTAAQVAGGAIVLAGVLLMQWNTIRAARRPASAA